MQDYRADSPERTQWATMNDDLRLAYSDAYFSPPLTSATTSSYMSSHSTSASFDTTVDAQELWGSGNGPAPGYFDTTRNTSLTAPPAQCGNPAAPSTNQEWQYQQNPPRPHAGIDQPSVSSGWIPQGHPTATDPSWSSQLSPPLPLATAPSQAGARPRQTGLTPDAYHCGRHASPFASAGSSIASTSPDVRRKSPRLKVEGSKTPPDSSPGNSEGNATTTSKEPRKKPRRKAHNAIEKRYRVKLNEKIAELRDSIPSLRVNNAGLAPEGFYEGDSPVEASAPKINKAHILEKATEYVKELEASNRHLQEELYRERTRPGPSPFGPGCHASNMDHRGQPLGPVPMVTTANRGNTSQPWPYTFEHLVPDDTATLPQPGPHSR